MYDIIGDIHGHADALESLLQKMDYQKKSGAYAHPERKVIFLGDFLDRGPKISQVLETVYPMLESGSAKSVMTSTLVSIIDLVMKSVMRKLR